MIRALGGRRAPGDRRHARGRAGVGSDRDGALFSGQPQSPQRRHGSGRAAGVIGVLKTDALGIDPRPCAESEEVTERDVDRRQAASRFLEIGLGPRAHGFDPEQVLVDRGGPLGIVRCERIC